MFISCLGPCRGCILRPAGPPECRIFCPLECGSLQVVAATRHTRSSINMFIDRRRGPSRWRRARAPATAGAPASAKEASNWCLAWVLALGKSS